MGSVFDYIKWRGDLDFDRDGLNEVDALVFSILCYMDVDTVLHSKVENDQILLTEAVARLEKVFAEMKGQELPFFKDIPDFMMAVAKTKRFGSVRLSRYVDQLDPHHAKQFSATVYTFGPGQHFVAFRGTDDSVAGWKEDLQMAYQKYIPAQQEGANYLREVMDRLEGVFYLGGHSKGGNVAIFAAANMADDQKASIQWIYNFDGPGFHPEFIQGESYKSVVARVKTVLPESSVVGVLLEQETKYKAVRCASSLALMQHNPFLWEVEGDRFVEAKRLSKKSKAIGTTVQAWLNQLTLEEQESFVNTLFSVLEEAGIQRFADVSKDAFAAAQGIIKAFSKTDDAAKEHIKKVVDMLWDESGRTLTRNFVTDVGVFFAKNKRRLSNKLSEKEEILK
jgi:hypothetical protein